MEIRWRVRSNNKRSRKANVIPVMRDNESFPDKLALELASNTVDGAGTLARQALRGLRAHIETAAGADIEHILRCAQMLKTVRPGIAAIGSLLQHWMDSVPTIEGPRDDVRKLAIRHCDRVLARADQAFQNAIAVGCERLAGISGTDSDAQRVLYRAFPACHHAAAPGDRRSLRAGRRRSEVGGRTRGALRLRCRCRSIGLRSGGGGGRRGCHRRAFVRQQGRDPWPLPRPRTRPAPRSSSSPRASNGSRWRTHRWWNQRLSPSPMA